MAVGVPLVGCGRAPAARSEAWGVLLSDAVSWMCRLSGSVCGGRSLGVS